MKPISVNKWFWILLLLSIPIINIILVIAWAMKQGTTNQNLINFSRAILLWVVVCMAIAILLNILGAI